jgi:cytosine/adenosine deaminase-related metal-dependent hydrolase
MSAVMPGICFINAALEEGVGTLRVRGSRIAAVNGLPARGDRIVDLQGDRLLPGLINAHDHLQLNNFAPTRYRTAHRNVSEWIDDVTAHRRDDAMLGAAMALGFEDRLYAGGLKNLLSGVTSVAHHDAWHATFDDASFPVRVLRGLHWTHSLGVSGEREAVATHRSTPAGAVWIIHAGEGIDDEAANEFARLEATACIDARSLLVHALGFTPEQRARLAALGGAAVWCPASNQFLFGRTLDPRPLLDAGRLALGTDSRLSGARDLLEELRAAARAAPLSERELEWLVTRHNARLLRLTDRGSLVPGMLADLVVFPAAARLADTTRDAVRLVMLGGRMRYGDVELEAALEPRADCVPVRIDGREKRLDRQLATRLARGAWREPGLTLPDSVWRAA